MAIRFPTPKKANKPISTTNDELNALIDSMDQPVSVQQTQIINEQVSLKPTRKAVDKKQLALLGVLLLVGLGALAYYFLPSLLEKNEPAPTPVVKSTPKPVVKPASALAATNNASATASTPNLNKQTIVITGDHLKNGVTASTAQAANVESPQKPNPTEQNTPMNASDNPPTNGDVAFAGDNGAGAGDGKDQINKSSKSSMSYAEFVKTSESTVYADDSAPSAAAAAKK